MRITLRDGVRLFVDVDGASLRPTGPTMTEVPSLVLLHGGPGFDHSPFKAFFGPLAGRVQLVYYDHRGMGRSDASDPSNWNLATWADDLADLLAQLGITRPILLGQSFGGFVALEYAVTRSAGLAGLVLSSTGARHVPGDCYEAFARLGGPIARAACEAFFDRPCDETFTRYCADAMGHYNTMPQDPLIRRRQLTATAVLHHFWATELRSFDLRPRLPRITCPTLVVAGEEDPITPPQRSREIAAALDPARTRLCLLPGAGHGAYRDTPDDFEEALTAFLDAVADDEGASRPAIAAR